MLETDIISEYVLAGEQEATDWQSAYWLLPCSKNATESHIV